MTDSQRKACVRFALVAVGLVVALATDALSQAADIRPHDPGWDPPARAVSLPNPLASDPGVTAGGRKLFEQRCVQCHGQDARGSSRAPDLTRRAVQSQTDGALYWRISSGNAFAGMPGFSYLPEVQRWQLVLQLRALATPTPLRSHQPTR